MQACRAVSTPPQEDQGIHYQHRLRRCACRICNSTACIHCEQGSCSSHDSRACHCSCTRRFQVQRPLPCTTQVRLPAYIDSKHELTFAALHSSKTGWAMTRPSVSVVRFTSLVDVLERPSSRPKQSCSLQVTKRALSMAPTL